MVDMAENKQPCPPGIGNEAESARLAAVLLAFQIGFLIFTRLAQAPIYTDDAFIHFRNSLNFANGDGLLFNPGEPIIGTTSPLFTLILGVLHWATRLDLLQLAKIFNFTCDVGILLLSLSLLKQVSVPLAFRHAIAFALSAEPLRMIYSSSGMEMSLFILAALAIIVLFDRDRWILSGVILGCLGWIRPEGVTVGVAVVFALAVTRNFSTLWKGVALATVVAALGAGVLLATYGTVFPQSLDAKANGPWFTYFGGDCPQDFFIALGKISPFYAISGFQVGWETSGQRIASIAVACSEVLIMGIGSIYLIRRKAFAGSALSAFAVLYYLFYAITNPMIFEWYFVPYLFVPLLLAGIGWWVILSRVIGWAEKRGVFRDSRLRPSSASGAVAYVLCFWIVLGNHAADADSHPFGDRSQIARFAFRYQALAPTDRMSLYIQAGREMDRWRGDRRDLTAATPEIGAFSYYYGGRVLDPYGLVSPEALDLIKPGVRESLPESCQYLHPLNIYLIHRPDFIMTSDLFLNETPPPFFEVFEEIERPDIPFLRFFVRRDLEESIKSRARAH